MYTVEIIHTIDHARCSFNFGRNPGKECFSELLSVAMECITGASQQTYNLSVIIYPMLVSLCYMGVHPTL